ncbi:MAG TPA: multicopper oxidase domain-containing protein [Candidatus Babeliales bacterium]|nr:multicopper oxidase domain-containing protein [Candidatus Babeliales bacterium]
MPAFAAALVVCAGGFSAAAWSDAATTIVANDNRVPAGVLSHGVLKISLDATAGLWSPDGPSGVVLPVEAFAQSGDAPQIPGPLVRVPRGTVVVATVRNSIPGTLLAVHGLTDRPSGQGRPLALRYGQARTVRFLAAAPGTYYYWGTTTNNTVQSRTGRDTLLSGAIVIDDPRARWSERNDRVFVIDEWDGALTKHGGVDFDFEINAINGREYPYDEHLFYPVGSLVHWRIINTSAQSHPLHLHGFYYTVDSRGDGLTDDVAPDSAYHDLRVTELVPTGRTESITWRADRPGNWLFHCHISYHTMLHAPFSKMGDHAYLNAYAGKPQMGGMILLITVTPRPGWGPVVVAGPVRHIGLQIEPTARDAPDVPAFRYVLEESGTTMVSTTAIGPPIVLTRGAPVDITVTNHLSEATAVHWHGIEQQDSYYDGVPMISGYGSRLEPMIMPGDSFDVRFTPPRAGTFIYHTHLNDVVQSMGGLSGPLIVLPPGERFDPATDHVIEISTPRNFANYFDLNVNGTLKPAALTVASGVPQRFRFINMTMFDFNAVVALASSSGPASWTPIAVDGADLPLPLRVEEPAVQHITIGQTRDFSFTAPAPGEYSLMFWSDAGGKLRMTIPIHVVPATAAYASSSSSWPVKN